MANHVRNLIPSLMKLNFRKTVSGFLLNPKRANQSLKQRKYSPAVFVLKRPANPDIKMGDLFTVADLIHIL